MRCGCDGRSYSRHEPEESLRALVVGRSGGGALLLADRRIDHLQLLVHGRVIGAIGEHADDLATSGLLGLVDQLLELALTGELLLRGRRELLAVVKLILARIREEVGTIAGPRRAAGQERA